jgi:FkbM family methyltransferase
MRNRRKIKINQESFFISKEKINSKYPWNKLEQGWEKHTYKLFDTFLSQSSSYIDLGAWIGMTVLYGARKAKTTYTAEPDPIALEHLRKNIGFNHDIKDKIHLYEGAISDSNGMIDLHKKKGRDFGNSASSLVPNAKFGYGTGQGDRVLVPTMTFKTFMKHYDISDCNFIKMDIEGAELMVIPTMKKYLKAYKPTLYLSLHKRLFRAYEANKGYDRQELMDTLKIYSNFYDKNMNRISWNKIFRYKEIIATDD